MAEDVEGGDRAGVAVVAKDVDLVRHTCRHRPGRGGEAQAGTGSYHAGTGTGTGTCPQAQAHVQAHVQAQALTTQA